MPELTPKERLQPSLLDRLTDDQPDSQVESRDRRVMSPRQFREAVLRDLAWLLNTSQHRDDEEISESPEAARSVVNFGVRDLSGLTSSGVSPEAVEREVLRSIKAFEPRLIPQTLEVRVVLDRDSMTQNALGFEIHGELWSVPFPDPLYVRTEVDLETGLCTIEESRRG